MPKMNGWEFIQAYQQLEIAQKGKVVLVMLTPSVNPADEARASNIEEIHTFKTKPLNKTLLKEILKPFF